MCLFWQDNMLLSVVCGDFHSGITFAINDEVDDFECFSGWDKAVVDVACEGRFG